MSLGVYVDCDVCSDTLTAGPVGSGSIIRAEARESGWHTGLPGGVDICDDCWRNGHRGAGPDRTGPWADKPRVVEHVESEQ